MSSAMSAAGLLFAATTVLALAVPIVLLCGRASLRTMVALAALMPPPVVLVVHARTLAHVVNPGPGAEAIYWALVVAATLALLSGAVLLVEAMGVFTVLGVVGRALRLWWLGRGWVFGWGWRMARPAPARDYLYNNYLATHPLETGTDTGTGTATADPWRPRDDGDGMWAEDREARAYWAWRVAAEEAALARTLRQIAK